MLSSSRLPSATIHPAIVESARYHEVRQPGSHSQLSAAHLQTLAFHHVDTPRVNVEKLVGGCQFRAGGQTCQEVVGYAPVGRDQETLHRRPSGQQARSVAADIPKLVNGNEAVQPAAGEGSCGGPCTYEYVGHYPLVQALILRRSRYRTASSEASNDLPNHSIRCLKTTADAVLGSGRD